MRRLEKGSELIPWRVPGQPRWTEQTDSAGRSSGPRPIVAVVLRGNCWEKSGSRTGEEQTPDAAEFMNGMRKFPDRVSGLAVSLPESLRLSTARGQDTYGESRRGRER